MDVSITGRNIKITDTLEEYANRKLSRLDRYLPNIMAVNVELSSQNMRRGATVSIAQITIRHKRGAILRSEQKVNGDITVAIDSAVDHLYRRIERFKGKRQRKGGERFTASIEELNLAEELPELDIPEEELNQAEEIDQIVRRKQVGVSPMTEAEAIEQMELLGHTFFLFYNVDNGTVNVVYKRHDGNYGVLIPEVQ